MKILKGLFFIISIACIAFTLFFVYSYATHNTAVISFIAHQITKIAGGNTADAQSNESKNATVSMLTESYGLSSSQANEVMSIAEELGVDTSDSNKVESFIAKNAGNASKIQEIANAVNSGTMTETEAKIKLAGILDV